MSIRRTSTPPIITADDLQWTFKGRKFAVELSDLGGWQFVVLLEWDGSAWANAGAEPLDKFADADITAAGGAMGWIKTVFVPWLQAALDKLFPPGVAPAGEVDVGAPQGPQPADPQDQVDAILGSRVTIVSLPNGSLQVRVVE